MRKLILGILIGVVCTFTICFCLYHFVLSSNYYDIKLWSGAISSNRTETTSAPIETFRLSGYEITNALFGTMIITKDNSTIALEQPLIEKAIRKGDAILIEKDGFYYFIWCDDERK